MNVSRKILASLVIVIVISSAFVVLGFFEEIGVLASSYTSLDLKVSPEGSSFKLGVNESKSFVAEALNGTAPFTYTWTLNPTGNFSLFINNELTQVSNASSLQVVGSELTLSYPVASEEYVSVSCSVKDANGYSGQLLMPFIVADPYTSPGYKFDGSTASASWIAQADGLGWFRIMKGLDGSVVSAYTSTNPSTTLNGALAQGGLLFITNGAYTGASLIVPATARIIAEPSVTGIKYASIASGARIDEPNFNGAFGGYSSGSYTIVTNLTSSATTATWYLTFKPDNSIYQSSTNPTTVAQAAINEMTSGLLLIKKGTYTGMNMDISDKPITIEGEGKSTLIYGSITAMNTVPQFQNIRNLALDDFDKSSVTLKLRYTVFSEFENIEIDRASIGMYLIGCISNVFTDVYVHDCTIGVKLEGVPSYGCNANKFVDLIISSGNPDILLYGDARGNQFIGCDIEAGVGDLVTFQTNRTGTSDICPSGNTFTGCWFEVADSSTTTINSTLDASSTIYASCNNFVGNFFEGGTMYLRGNGTIFRENTFNALNSTITITGGRCSIYDIVITNTQYVVGPYTTFIDTGSDNQIHNVWNGTSYIP